MNLQFYLKNANQFGEEARRLIESAARVEVTAQAELRVLAEAVRRIYGSFVRAEAPVGKRDYTDAAGNKHPGYLRKTIKGQIQSTAGGLVVSFASQAPYTRYVIEGTAPHVIRPVNAKALRFEVGGQVVYAKQVNHPGTKPNPFNVRAYDRSKPAINAALDLVGRTICLSFRG